MSHRILYLAANRWWTGSAEPILGLVQGLRQRGHEVWLGLIQGERFEQMARQVGVPLLVGLSLSPKRAWAIPADVGYLRKFIKEHRITIVHCNHSHDHWIAALSLGKGQQAPLLVRTFHNRGAVKEGRVHRWLYRRTAGFMAVSAGIEARCYAIGLHRNLVCRLPGAVDLTRFNPSISGERIREGLGLGDGLVYGMVSRLVAGRGHQLLLAGFQQVTKTIPGARLLLVGKGEGRPSIERLIARLNLGRSVVFAGYRGPDLPEVLAAMDIFLLMGAGSEETCRAALEAMAVARPVIARAVGALPETVVEGETGHLLQEPDPQRLAAIMIALAKDPERSRNMGQAGRRRVETHFDGRERLETVEKFYHSLLSQGRA